MNCRGWKFAISRCVEPRRGTSGAAAPSAAGARSCRAGQDSNSPSAAADIPLFPFHALFYILIFFCGVISSACSLLGRFIFSLLCCSLNQHRITRISLPRFSSNISSSEGIDLKLQSVLAHCSAFLAFFPFFFLLLFILLFLYFPVSHYFLSSSPFIFLSLPYFPHPLFSRTFSPFNFSNFFYS